MKTMGMFLLIIVIAMTYVPVQAQSVQGNGSQTAPNAGPNIFYRAVQGAGGAAVAVNIGGDATVQGAPYSAVIEISTVQTLADGNRIVFNSTGEIARDSHGRTRRQMELPAIGNLSAANPPQMVFIQDPVAQATYTLNLSDKTAQKMPAPQIPPSQSGAGGGPTNTAMIAGAAGGGPLVTSGSPVPLPFLPPPPGQGMVFLQSSVILAGEPGQNTPEDLGLQVMDGIPVNGTRSTLTIPAGQIGNDQPINVVTEIWISPDLKTTVYSKRDDPRTVEQTFRLTQISRNEPDPSLFTVPADFIIVDSPQPVVYVPKP